ncbi:MAG: ribonuclease E/G [Rhodospirillales bacterium]|nr:ribonuclease E/G [Rhodospirillales bacterium]
MTKRMLIDATHVEETRVVICDGSKLIEYDYESKNRKPLKGSIFLAKVTRVEPSLQAAFVNFGGNRHGFLPFSEIHPDYFRIPIEDREALMAEQEAILKAHDEQEKLEEEALDQQATEQSVSEGSAEEDFEAEEHELPQIDEVGGMMPSVGDEEDEDERTATAEGVAVADDDAGDVLLPEQEGDSFAGAPVEVTDIVVDGAEAGMPEGEPESTEARDAPAGEQQEEGRRGRRGRRFRGGRGRRRSAYRNPNVEVVGGEDIEGGDASAAFRFNLRRKYKIQEVIKRGQIMLIQVSKEERGNKGAAVTTYLSLAGRYCVLMPNSPRGGGVSRKIANQKDRSRMRDIMKDLEVPAGMSVILRTAGVSRTKVEIKRDLDYLLRLWDTIRDLTLQSTAPALVYEEADLIKRSIRDLYDRDVEEVLVAGSEGFKNARDFMKMLIPSHVKKVQSYEEAHLPLFTRYQVESQISEIGQNQVRLRSGGYLVINPTEALVSIDVNSGKATKERHIEETALNTNLEAADEIARQLKLRDLGGLVVIDFIDMEDRRNNARVERRMRDALSKDRARVQVGRISSFGLMELSRQRLNPSLTEAQYETCHNCKGAGLVRTEDAMSIVVLRAIEEEGIRGRAAQLVVNITSRVALYILNYKRSNLADIEKRYGLEVLIRVDDEIGASEYRIEVSKPSEKAGAVRGAEAERPQVSEFEPEETTEDFSDAQDDEDENIGNRKGSEDEQDDHSGNRRDNRDHQRGSGGQRDGGRRRGRRGGRGRRDKRREGRSEFGEGNQRDGGGSERGERPARKNDSPKNDPPEEQRVSEPVLAVSSEAVPVSKAEHPAPRSERKDRSPSSSASYEVVSEAPKSKKKGWWNRLIE